MTNLCEDLPLKLFSPGFIPGLYWLDDAGQRGGAGGEPGGEAADGWQPPSGRRPPVPVRAVLGEPHAVRGDEPRQQAAAPQQLTLSTLHSTDIDNHIQYLLFLDQEINK